MVRASKYEKQAYKLSLRGRRLQKDREDQHERGDAWDRYFASKPGTMSVPRIPMSLAMPQYLDEEN